MSKLDLLSIYLSSFGILVALIGFGIYFFQKKAKKAKKS